MLAAESSAASTWIPIATLLLGFATGQIADWVKDRRTYHRERDTRAEARNDAKREHHNAFQRETLLSLQDASLDLLRTSSYLQSFNIAMFKKHGKPAVEPYPADIYDTNTLAKAKTTLLGVRIADGEVRSLLKAMKEFASHALLSSTTDEDAARDMYEAHRAFFELNERIGLLLRRLDAEDAPQQIDFC